MDWKKVAIAVFAFGVLAPLALAEDGHVSELDIHEIVAALEEKDLSANELRTIESFDHIDIVDLSALKQDPAFNLVERALTRTDDGWAMIQTAIVANDIIKQELLRRSIPIRAVAAATLNDDTLTIYID